jgi:hypothetical protein
MTTSTSLIVSCKPFVSLIEDVQDFPPYLIVCDCYNICKEMIFLCYVTRSIINVYMIRLIL